MNFIKSKLLTRVDANSTPPLWKNKFSYINKITNNLIYVFSLSINPNIRQQFIDKVLSSYISYFISNYNNHNWVVKLSKYMQILFDSDLLRSTLIVWNKEIWKAHIQYFYEKNWHAVDHIDEFLYNEFINNDIISQDYYTKRITYKHDTLQPNTIAYFLRKNNCYDIDDWKW